MPDTTVHVEHELSVDAATDQVWALARSLAALSALPGRFAFDVAGDAAGVGRLCCLITDIRTVIPAMHDVRQEIAGQMICWQSRSTRPAGIQTFTLAVLRRPSGSTLRLSVSDAVPQLQAIVYRTYWQTQVWAWGNSLRAIAEGRDPWPSPEIPVRMHDKCSIPRPPKNPVQVSASVVIHAPAAAVWEAIYAQESLRLIIPGEVAHVGHVPGTPERKAGDMHYVVRRRPEQRFTVNVAVITELVEGVSAVSQSIAPPHVQIHHRLTHVADGTRLELKCCWPAPSSKTEEQNEMADATKQLQEQVNGYKTLIEKRV
jgi:uncharacterized protein YndB with AHSA1/START domain